MKKSLIACLIALVPAMAHAGSWTEFATGNVAEAGEVNANFDYVDEHFLPFSQTGIETDATYNIGSAAYRWNDGYFAGAVRSVGYKAKVSRSGQGTMTTGSAVTWNTEVTDTQNMHDTSTNTSRLTVPTNGDGFYYVSLNLAYSQNDSTYLLMENNVRIVKYSSGGTELETVANVGFSSQGNGASYTGIENRTMRLSTGGLVDAVAGDYFQVIADHSSSGTSTFYVFDGNDTFFTAMRLF